MQTQDNRVSAGLNLEEMITLYGDDVLRMAYLYVKNKDTAEDIFQEVFIKVSLHHVSFEERSSLKTWILRITINTCKDFLKSAWNRKVDYEEQQLDGKYFENGYKEVENSEQKKIIYDTVLALPLKYREIILCVYYKELSMHETANLLHISEGTVKSRLSRAKEKMRKLLEGRYVDYEN